MNETTSPMKSKTIITNATVMAALPLLKAFGIEPDMELILAFLPLANILLRMVTKTKLG